MTGIRKILVPVDFSESSAAALDAALSVAERFGAEIEVLHVWEPPKFVRPDLMVWMEHEGEAESLAEYTQGEAKKELDQLLASVDRGQTKVVARFEVGDAAPTIVKTAEDRGHDLVVVGTHGRTGLSRFFLGSVAEKVVRRSPCPVMTLHAGDAGDPPRAEAS